MKEMENLIFKSFHAERKKKLKSEKIAKGAVLNNLYLI